MSASSMLADPGVKRAAYGLGAAVLLFGWFGVRALRLDAVPDAAAAPIEASMLKSGGPREFANIAGAVDRDPFSASRSAPTGRYLLPWEAVETKTAEVAPKPQVLGTAIALDGRSFATCQLGSSTPRIVHVGDKLGEYTVKSIARGRVVFTTPSGSSLDISANK